MDCGSVYIKMCEYLPFDHAPQAGDYYFARGNIVILPQEKHIKDFCTYECLYLVGEDEYIWLPTQSQLQEMIIDYWKQKEPYFEATTPDVRVSYFLRRIVKFYEFTKQGYADSMEKLCLGIVMEELYKKHWNGKEWFNA